MVMAVRAHSTGGPEVLQWETVQLDAPGPGEVLLTNTAVGLNYIDVYHRNGSYPAGDAPFIVGLEGAGIVEDVGPDVPNLRPGERVAYASMPLGAYAEKRIMPAERLVKLPDAISDGTAAAMMLQGMTAQYLLRRTYAIKHGDTILFHAIAGGVGLIACQWAKHLGATVIGTVGSEEKAELARAHGCDHTIDYTQEDFAARVMAITGGMGVPVVYDSVGADTFEKSLDSLRPLGMLVSFGQSSGKIPPFDAGVLAAKGSLYLTRPTLFDYTRTRDDLVNSAGELFDLVKRGVIAVKINQTYPLRDAAQAHRDLEARKTTGSTILIPD